MRFLTALVVLQLVSILNLAACSDVKHEAVIVDRDRKLVEKKEAKQAESAGLKPQPGLYKTTITLTGIDIPGLPEDMKGHGAGLVRTLESCLTQAEVDRGFETLLVKGQDGACSFENFALKDGAFQAMLVCEAQGATTRTAMEGTATATGADFTAATKMGFGGTEGTMSVSGQHRRAGDCPAEAETPPPAK